MAPLIPSAGLGRFAEPFRFSYDDHRLRRRSANGQTAPYSESGLFAVLTGVFCSRRCLHPTRLCSCADHGDGCRPSISRTSLRFPVRPAVNHRRTQNSLYLASLNFCPGATARWLAADPPQSASDIGRNVINTNEIELSARPAVWTQPSRRRPRRRGQSVKARTAAAQRWNMAACSRIPLTECLMASQFPAHVSSEMDTGVIDKRLRL